ncbi:MAG: hypothetical protein ACI9N0_001735 [Ilumatobacter sp.]|jgi:hypothetical protein
MHRRQRIPTRRLQTRGGLTSAFDRRTTGRTQDSRFVFLAGVGGCERDAVGLIGVPSPVYPQTVLNRSHVRRTICSDSWVRARYSGSRVPRYRPIYRCADPLGRNPHGVQSAGQGAPWHFDAENYEHVAHILAGGRDGVRQLDLIPGDLQLFAGRHSLHRVTPIGATTRHHALQRAAHLGVRPAPDEPLVPLRHDLRTCH